MVVRLFRPQFTNSDIDNIKDVFDMAWVGLGSYVERFEKKWSLEVNSQFSIATNSGTAALHLALASLQLPKGSKVLVPSMTFAASALSILYNDLTPVFVDCDEETLCVSTDDLKLKISDASALILVHFG